MGSTKNIGKLLFLAVAILSLHTVFSNTSIPNGILLGNVTGQSDLVGTWQYTVASAPLEYSTGVLSIVKDDGEYAVQVQLTGGTLKGENVSVDGNTIRFKVNIEGGMVSVELAVTGDEITGTSSSSEGIYTIEGERLKPQ